MKPFPAMAPPVALARVLVNAGVPDQPWQCVNDSGQRSVYGSSLHRLATRTVSEAAGHVRWATWAPRPDFEDALEKSG
jgi:hypothetical protein